MSEADDCDYSLQEQLRDRQESNNYSVITFNTRFRLLEMVILEKYYILKAAKILGLKLSTAKYIIRCYRCKGKIMRKFQQGELSEREIEKKVKSLRERENKVKKVSKRQHRIINELLSKKTQNEINHEYLIRTKDEHQEKQKNPKMENQEYIPSQIVSSNEGDKVNPQFDNTFYSFPTQNVLWTWAYFPFPTY